MPLFDAEQLAREDAEFQRTLDRIRSMPSSGGVESQGVWGGYVKPAIHRVGSIIGTPYRGLSTAATALFDPENLRLPAGEGGFASDAAAALGLSDEGGLQGVETPFGLAAEGVRRVAGGLGPQDVDPEWEAAFRAAAPRATAAEALGTAAGEFGTQMVLDPVQHGLGALGARAAGATSFNVLPEFARSGAPALYRALESRLPSAVAGLAPETAGAAAKGLAGAFVPGMLLSGAERLAEAPAAVAEHGLVSPEFIESGVQGAFDAAMGLAGLSHALRRAGPRQLAPEVAPAAAAARTAGSAEDAFEFDPNYRAPERQGPPVPSLDSQLDFGEGRIPFARERGLDIGPEVQDTTGLEFDPNFALQRVPQRPQSPIESGLEFDPREVPPEYEFGDATTLLGQPAEVPAPRSVLEFADERPTWTKPKGKQAKLELDPGAVGKSVESLPIPDTGLELVDESASAPAAPETAALPGEKFSISPATNRTVEDINAEMETLLRGKRTKAVEKRLLELRDERDAAAAAPTETAPAKPDLLSAFDEIPPLAKGGTGQADTVSIPRLWEHVKDTYAGDRAAFDRDVLELRKQGKVEAQKGDTGLSEADYAGSIPDPAGGTGRFYALTKRSAKPSLEGQRAAASAESFNTIVDKLKQAHGEFIREVKPAADGGVQFRYQDRTITLTPEREIRIQYAPEHGKVGLIKGSHISVNGESFIRLTEGQSDFTTLLHEYGHGILEVLSPGRKRVLFEKNGFNLKKMTPEEIARAEEVVVQKWAEDADRHLETLRATGSTKAAPGWFKRMWEFIQRVFAAWKEPTYQGLMEELATGRALGRGRAEKVAEKAGEWWRDEPSTPPASSGPAKNAFAGDSAVQSKLNAELRVSERAKEDWVRAQKAAGRSTRPEGFVPGPGGTKVVDEWQRPQIIARELAILEDQLRELRNDLEVGKSSPILLGEHNQRRKELGLKPVDQHTLEPVSTPSTEKFQLGSEPSFPEAEAARLRAEEAKQAASAAYKAARTSPEAAPVVQAEREVGKRSRELKKALNIEEKAAVRENVPRETDQPELETVGYSGGEAANPVDQPLLDPTQVGRRVRELKSDVEAFNKDRADADKYQVDLERESPESWATMEPDVKEILRKTPIDKLLATALADKRRGKLPDARHMTAIRVGVDALREASQRAAARVTEMKAAGQNPDNAAGQMLIATAERMQAIAMKAALDGQETLLNVGTGAGRLLSSMRRVLRGHVNVNDAILNTIIREMGGSYNAKALEHLKSVLADPRGDASHVENALREVFQPTMLDKIVEYWKNGLVSAPASQIANPGGNVIESVTRLAETQFAPAADAIYSKMAGKERTRFAGEGKIAAKGIRKSYADAAARLGTELKDILTLAPEDFTDAFTGDNYKGGLLRREVGAIGPGPAWVQKALGKKFHLGRAVRMPLRLMGAADNFFYSLAVGAETGKLSYREARKQLGAKADEAAVQRLAEEIYDKVRNTGEYSEITKRAFDEANSWVFRSTELNDPSHVARLLVHARSKHPTLNFIVPFISTPLQIAKLIWQRSPGGLLSASKAWKKYATAEKAGLPEAEIGKLRDNALDLSARASLGLALTSVFYGLASSGVLTGKGPSDVKKRQALLDTGWQPYSVVIGSGESKTYIPYSRFEPIAGLLGIVADFGAGEKKTPVEAASAALSNITSRTFLEGLNQFFELLSRPEEALPGYVSQLAGSFVPNVVAKSAQAVDPIVRETKPASGSTAERVGRTIAARVPGVSTKLPARYGATGKGVERPNAGSVAGAVSRFASPVQITSTKPGTAVEAEMARIGYTPTVPDRKVKVAGRDLEITETEHRRLTEEYRHAAERAARILKSPAYKAAPDDAGPGKTSKRNMLKAVFDQANRRWRARHAPALMQRARAAQARA